MSLEIEGRLQKVSHFIKKVHEFILIDRDFPDGGGAEQRIGRAGNVSVIFDNEAGIAFARLLTHEEINDYKGADILFKKKTIKVKIKFE